MLSACAHANRSTCLGSASDVAGIGVTIRSFFDALRKDDAVAFQRLTTPSFYAFDVGKRFEGTELSSLVRDAHTRGVRLNWNIGKMDTRIGCDMAWVAWENVGSAGILRRSRQSDGSNPRCSSARRADGRSLFSTRLGRRLHSQMSAMGGET